MLGFPLTCMVGKRAKENSFFLNGHGIRPKAI